MAPDRGNIESLKAALSDVFQDPQIAEISPDNLLGEYPAVQSVPPDGGFHIDILTRFGEAWRFENLEVERAALRAIAETWAAARSLAPLRSPPGAYRHRTIEELNAQPDAWSRENICLLAERRPPAGPARTACPERR